MPSAMGGPASWPVDVLLVLAILLPAAGSMLALALGGRLAEASAAIFLPVGACVSLAIAVAVGGSGRALHYDVGAWAPPLGLQLRADGLSAAMLQATALLVCVTGLFAWTEFRTAPGEREKRSSIVFWPLLLALWSALNAVFLGNDLFNLYVALELLTVSAVPLVSLSGRPEALAAALRYLLFALIGSVLYLLGAALLYGQYGTLDIGLLAGRARAEPAVLAAAALMTMGLVAKTALFPLHLWLPLAHASAPAAASALLSGLVVKASFFLIVRLWFDALPGVLAVAAAQILAAMGAGAIVFGSVLALRQARLKLLVAYSTVAQIGYLFLMFPLVAGAEGNAWSHVAWTGGWIQLTSHACAKASMFMAAGLIAEAVGHDRISELGGIGRALPVTLAAFALSALSLIGLPPSGGFVAKSMMLTAAVVENQWWWAVVILVGGLLAAGYIFPVLMQAFARVDGGVRLLAPVSRRRELLALLLALCAFMLGFLPLGPLEFLQIGRPDGIGSALR